MVPNAGPIIDNKLNGDSREDFRYLGKDVWLKVYLMYNDLMKCKYTLLQLVKLKGTNSNIFYNIMRREREIKQCEEHESRFENDHSLDIIPKMVNDCKKGIGAAIEKIERHYGLLQTPHLSPIDHDTAVYNIIKEVYISSRYVKNVIKDYI